jgi:hypothetical protein
LPPDRGAVGEWLQLGDGEIARDIFHAARIALWNGALSKLRNSRSDDRRAGTTMVGTIEPVPPVWGYL